MSYSDQHHDGSYERLKQPLFVPKTDQLKRVKNDRLPGPDGTEGTGMPLKEAIRHAMEWWGRVQPGLRARSSAQAEFGGLPSGIARGLPWEELTRAEILRVIDVWYEEIGLPRMVRGEDDPDVWILDPLAHMGGDTEQK